MLILLLNSNVGFSQSNEQFFTKKEILDDLHYLYETLEDTHYNLYAYTSKEDFAANYQKVKASLTDDSINVLEATNFLQRVISVANNGHTEIDFPSAIYRAYAYSGGTLFPLEISFEEGKSLVRKNFSSNATIEVSTELLSINGLSMDAILAKIYPQLSAERIYLKNAKIEMYSFPRCYWQVFGKQDVFEIRIKKDGKVRELTIEAIDLIQEYETKRNEILNAEKELLFYKNAAYLNPGNFAGDEEQYQQFIDSAFVAIKDKNSQNLIIDLRNNAGGNDSFSDYLVAYIADKPFRWSSRLTLKTSKLLKEHTRKNNDTTEVYFQNILNHKNGETYSFEFEDYQPKAKEKKFTKDVFVLVNRQSYSQSAVTAAQIQDYRFGTIVGEETGDYPTLFASQFYHTLPNTGIQVKVSKGQIVRVNGSEKEEGVIPDLVIKDHLLDEKDEILTGLLRKLK